jgi:hypothetical protein
MFALHSRGVSLLLAGSLFAISIPSSAGYPTNITERGINTVNGLYVCDGVNFAGFVSGTKSTLMPPREAIA